MKELCVCGTPGLLTIIDPVTGARVALCYACHTKQYQPVGGTKHRGPCLIWEGTIVGSQYGGLPTTHPLRVKTGETAVHRAIWVATHGPIPAGQIVRHKCDHPRCYNIRHLVLSTDGDNWVDETRQRQVMKAWKRPQPYSQCPQGHGMISPRYDHNREVVCRTCTLEETERREKLAKLITLP